MRTRRSRIPLLAGAIVLALLGLVILQALLLANAYDLREETFRQSVWSSLTTASIRLETGMALRQALQNPGELSPPGTYMTMTGTILRGDPAGNNTAPAPISIEGESLRYRVARPQRVQIQVSDGFGRDSTILDTLTAAGTHLLPFRGAGSHGYFFRFTTDSSAFVVAAPGDLPPVNSPPPSTQSERRVVVSRVIDNLWVGRREPIEKRLKPATLDSVLRRSLMEGGIPLEFSCGVLAPDSTGRDTVAIASESASLTTLTRSEFRVPLDALGPFGGHYRLAVDFPGRRSYLLGLLWPLLAGSFFFILAIGTAFAYTLRTVTRQGRLAAQMTDFINTMTHEFKTPISTVALASEAICRPDVVAHKSRVLHFNRMIADETARMKSQVDRILEFAHLEEGKVELTTAPLDAHQLIRSAAEAFQLQVKARHGELTLDCAAPRSSLRGDVVHLTNALVSLLDNGAKYSPGMPALSIRTENAENRLLIHVADAGRGIPQEYHRRVFEKYFRVPTGNIHDVKGFGLGLSYVRLVVDAHGGTTSLESTPGRGTTVTIALPLAE